MSRTHPHTHESLAEGGKLDPNDALRGGLIVGTPSDPDLSGLVTKTDGGLETLQAHGSAGSTETIDLGGGNWHSLTLTADCTITVTGFTPAAGCSVLVKVTQDGTGGWAIVWDSDIIFASGADDQPAQGVGDISWFVLASDEGDGTVYGFPVGGGSGGGETLAATLVLGNDAGGTDITDSGDLGLTATDNINVTAGAGSNVNINAPESINITADTDTDDSGAVVLEAGSFARVTVSAATEAVAIRTHGSAGGTGDFLASDGSGGTEWLTPTIPSGITDHEHIVNVVFSGDASATVWELPAAPVAADAIAVYVTGLRTIAWALSGDLLTTLTFDSAPASAANNIVIDIVAATA